jgi:hypothetical protein
MERQRKRRNAHGGAQSLGMDVRQPQLGALTLTEAVGCDRSRDAPYG